MAVTTNRAPPLALLAASLLILPGQLEGQACPLAPGCTQTLEQLFTFSATDQDMWAPPGEAAPEDAWLPLYDLQWSAADTARDLKFLDTFIGTVAFGAAIWGHSEGRFAQRFRVFGFDSSTFDLDYPVHVSVTVPEANTFRPGDPVTIRTGWEVRDPDLDVDFFPVGLEETLTMRLDMGGGMRFCFVACGINPLYSPGHALYKVTGSGNLPLFEPADIPEVTIPFVNTRGGMWGVFGSDRIFPAEPHDLTRAFKTISGSGLFIFPEPDGLTPRKTEIFGAPTREGTRISVDGEGVLMRLENDWARKLQHFDGGVYGGGYLPVLPPLNAELTLGSFELIYTTFSLDADATFSEREHISFDVDHLRLRVDLGEAMEFEVTEADGTVIESGNGATVDMPVGANLTLYYPDDVAPRTVTPTYSLVDPTVTRESTALLTHSLSAEALKFAFHLPSGSVGVTKYHEADYDWVSCDAISKAGSAGEFFHLLWKCTAGLITGTWKLIEAAWTELRSYAFSGAGVSTDPLYTETYADRTTSTTLLDTSWKVPLQPVQGPKWKLDPEDPSIAVSTSVVNSLLTTAMDAGTMTQTITVENTGDVPLNAASLLDAVLPSGLTAGQIQSFDLTVDPGFDGGGAAETLAAGQTLPVAGQGTVTVVWSATPGIYEVSVDAEGMSPIGTLVFADAATSFAWAAMDFRPRVMNPKSQGTFKTRLYGTADLDVRGIDPGSLRLEGVAPVQSKVKDPDEADIAYPYLELTFERQAVLEALQQRLASPATSPASVTSVAATPATSLKPSMDIDGFAALLLSRRTATLAADERVALDRAGNGNGRLDVGDLRARLFSDAEGATVLATAPAMAKGSGKGKGGDPPPPPDILILTGSVGGVPLYAEAPLVLDAHSKLDG